MDERKQLTRRFSRKNLSSKPGEPPPSPLLQFDVDIGTAANTKRWLCRNDLPAVPLGHGPISLGRHHECSIILPHVSISRRHAQIKARGKVVVFADLGSRNGSIINGKRLVKIKPVVLHPSDRLLIGPYLFEIREAPPQRSSSGRMPALSGSVEEGALVEVIQGIDVRKKTCTLKVQSGKTRGFLTVRNGRPLEARWGAEVNEEAVISLLGVASGEFALLNTAPEVESAFTLSLRALLFMALKRLDEGVHSLDTQKF